MEDLPIKINNDKYQVFLFTSRCPLPIPFASHLWFVINKKGALYRYEVTNHKNPKGVKHWGHIALNFLPFFFWNECNSLL
jgi:hypothetical protein